MTSFPFKALFVCYCQGSDRAAWAERSCKVIAEGEAFEQCRDHGENNHEGYYRNCKEQACRLAYFHTIEFVAYVFL